MIAIKGLTINDFTPEENLIFQIGEYYDMYKYITNVKISMNQGSYNNLLNDRLIFQMKAEKTFTY